METIFNLCVALLLDLADFTGMTYKEINVWIFCIIWPVLTIILCINNIRLRKNFQKLRNSLTEKISNK